MNHLHRELAPISAAAWVDMEAEARRTFERHVAARRIVDVPDPGGLQLAAFDTGHIDAIDPPADGVLAHLRRSQPIVELQAPFTVERQQVDDVERGAKDADWQPVKDAARRIGFAEDRVRRRSTAIRSASTSPGSWTARSSGRLPSTGHSCCPRAAATSGSASARTCPSATYRTMRRASRCTSRRR